MELDPRNISTPTTPPTTPPTPAPDATGRPESHSKARSPLDLYDGTHTISGGRTMALNSSQQERLASIASSIIEERDAAYRKAGGITPPTLQVLVGRWGMAVNPGFTVMPVPTIMRQMADLYEHNASTADGSMDEREYACLLLMITLSIAHEFVFDVYEGEYDFFNEILDNAITRHRAEDKRDVKRTVERG